MTPFEFHRTVLVPGLTKMTAVIGPKPHGGNWENEARARIFLSAIAGQETNWQNVAQIGGGPGRGFWQDESETCWDLVDNPISAKFMKAMCVAFNLQLDGDAIYAALLTNPLLEVIVSRLDPYCDPRPLPYTLKDAWTLYTSIWRPGDPEPERWSASYKAALIADQQCFPHP